MFNKKHIQKWCDMWADTKVLENLGSIISSIGLYKLLRNEANNMKAWKYGL